MSIASPTDVAVGPPETLPPHRLQVSLRGLLLFIVAIALVLGLMRLVDLIVVLPLAAVFLSLVIERVVGAGPTRQPRQSVLWYVASHFVVLACASLTVAAAWLGVYSHLPFPFVSPYPLLAVIPALYEPLFWQLALIPLGSFMIVNVYLARIVGRNPIPLRFPLLLTTATICSVWWFTTSWQYGVKYQGSGYTWAITAINVLFLIGLWLLWVVWRSRAPRAGAIFLATLFHCWLFWLAFPWLGEMI